MPSYRDLENNKTHFNEPYAELTRSCYRFPVFIVIVALYACGPHYTRTVMLENQLLDSALDGIVVGTVTLETERDADVVQDGTNANRNDVRPEELVRAYRTYLVESLVNNGIAHGKDLNKYVTNISILGFKEGNAFIRWLTPAGGESKVTVQATLEKDGVIIGGVESQQTIAWGGGFSIGGWNRVIRWSAKKVASELCQELFRHNTSEQDCRKK
jgi:hypothetical protein